MKFYADSVVEWEMVAKTEKYNYRIKSCFQYLDENARKFCNFFDKLVVVSN